jgi:Ca2+-binding EF-hand superfamily protein
MPLSTRDLIAVAEKREQEAKRAFAKYDADGSGTIDGIDIVGLLEELGLTRKLKQDKTKFLASCFASVGTRGRCPVKGIRD